MNAEVALGAEGVAATLPWGVDVGAARALARVGGDVEIVIAEDGVVPGAAAIRLLGVADVAEGEVGPVVPLVRILQDAVTEVLDEDFAVLVACGARSSPAAVSLVPPGCRVAFHDAGSP